MYFLNILKIENILRHTSHNTHTENLYTLILQKIKFSCSLFDIDFHGLRSVPRILIKSSF